MTEWYAGWNGNPPLNSLEKIYSSKWRKGNTQLGQWIGRRKLIISVLKRQTQGAVVPVQKMQEHLYAVLKTLDQNHSERSKRTNDDYNTVGDLRRYVNLHLRKQRPGFAGRSAELSKRRKKNNDE